MTECVTIAGRIADSVSISVIIDGDTGYGGIMALRRMVRECIRAAIAGIRVDDQPIESKRVTQSTGVEIVAIDQAIARYREAVAEQTSRFDRSRTIVSGPYRLANYRQPRDIGSGL